MNYLILIFITLFLSCQNERLQKTEKKTFYYFCVSGAKDKINQLNRKQILYTDVKEIVGEESIINKKAVDWGNLVTRICKNKGGCTSDLNSYPSLSEAKYAFDETIHVYNDTCKYYFKKVNFE